MEGRHPLQRCPRGTVSVFDLAFGLENTMISESFPSLSLTRRVLLSCLFWLEVYIDDLTLCQVRVRILLKFVIAVSGTCKIGPARSSALLYEASPFSA